MIKNLIKKLEDLRWQASLELQTASPEIERLRKKYLGRKGLLNQIFQEIAAMPAEARKEMGRQANVIKLEIEKVIAGLNLRSAGLDELVFDETIPGTALK